MAEGRYRQSLISLAVVLGYSLMCLLWFTFSLLLQDFPHNIHLHVLHNFGLCLMFLLAAYDAP